jgi:hypothetical protein
MTWGHIVYVFGKIVLLLVCGLLVTMLLAAIFDRYGPRGR